MKIEHLLGSIGGEFADEIVEELLRRSRDKVAKALKRIRRPAAAVGVVKSSLGDLLVAMSRRGVALTHYVHDGRDIAATLANLRLQFDPVEDQRTVREVGEEVSRYVAGDAKALRQHVDLTLAGNAFQKKVLDGLQTVPRGALVVDKFGESALETLVQSGELHQRSVVAEPNNTPSFVIYERR